jgi:hypothetical protein
MPLVVAWPLLQGIARRGEALRGWHTTFLAIAAPLAALHVVGRLLYYGAPVPNTFYAKATGDLLHRLGLGVGDIALFTFRGVGIPPVEVWVPAVLASVCAVAVLRHGSSGARAWLGGLSLVIGFRVAFDIWSGSDFMGDFRFLAPVLPPLIVLADEGFRTLRWEKVAAAGFAVALVTALLGNPALLKPRLRYQQGLEQAHFALGRWLADEYPPWTTLAIGDTGAAPFVSGLRTIDLWGLVDATIAHLPGEFGRREGTAAYALGRKPEIIVLRSLRPFEGGRARVTSINAFEREIAKHPDFRRHYRLVNQFTFRAQTGRANGYYLDVFQRVTGPTGR